MSTESVWNENVNEVLVNCNNQSGIDTIML